MDVREQSMFNLLKQKVDTLNTQIKYLISRPSTGEVVLAQVINIDGDLIGVDAYENGTYDQDGNEIPSTQVISDVISEDYDTLPTLGQWITILKVKQQWYSLIVQAGAISSSLKAYFFCDLFDRADGVLDSPIWTGALGGYLIDSGVLKNVNPANIDTVTNQNIRSYSISAIASVDALPVTPEGHVQSNVKTFYMYFGENRLFQLKIDLWQTESADGWEDKLDAYLAQNNDVDNLTQVLKNRFIDIGQSFYPGSTARLTKISQETYLGDSGNIMYFDTPGTGSGFSFFRISSSGYLREYPSIYAGDLVQMWSDQYNSRVVNLPQSLYCQVQLLQNNISVAVTPVSIRENWLEAPYVWGLIRTYNNWAFVKIRDTDVNGPTNISVEVIDDAIMVNVGGVEISYTNAAVIRNCDVIRLNPYIDLEHFKVWKHGQQEPMETGYGRYRSDGFLQYKDKYHTPITDESGVVTGYDYNPNA